MKWYGVMRPRQGSEGVRGRARAGGAAQRAAWAGGERRAGLRRVTVRNRFSLPDFLFVVKWAAPGQISYNASSVRWHSAGRGSEVAFAVSDDLPYFMFLPKDLSSSWIVSFMRIFRRNVSKYGFGDL